MIRVPRETSRALNALADDANWARILEWVTSSRDELRVANDEAEDDQVQKNQGGLRELNEIIRAALDAPDDMRRDAETRDSDKNNF